MMLFRVLRRKSAYFVLFALAALPTVAPVTAFYVPPSSADAQTRQAIQTVCDHADAAYGRRDLAGTMSMYAPGFLSVNVVGSRETFRQLQANIAAFFARDDAHGARQCVVSQVVTGGGGQVRALLHWHYATRFSRTATRPAYTYTRDYAERSVWTRLPAGWCQVSGRIINDTQNFRP